jgi:spermidine synthase
MLTQTLFALFVLSGFCGLVYQIVWLRLAFKSFGIATPVLSVVVSVFMLGLALGSWGAGRYITPRIRRDRLSPIYLYAAAEALIGISALLVPIAFDAGQQSLLLTGEIDSLAYFLYSALILAAVLLPACIAMGTTFPLMLAFIRGVGIRDENRFSFLYLGNVLGASLGAAITPLILVESFGFRGTLMVAAIVNFFIAAVSVALGLRYSVQTDAVAAAASGRRASSPSTSDEPGTLALVILFVTGFSSMGMEVIWTRAFTPVLGTYVYSFAGLLFVYLWATWLGSWWYRRDVAHGSVASTPTLLALVAITSLIPIVANDARFQWHRVMIALISIFPFCALLGYLTPGLIDRYSRDDPQRAGKAYAINVIGCVLGPLVAGYLLLPSIGARFGLVVLAIPFIVLFAKLWRSPSLTRGWRVAAAALTGALLVLSTTVIIGYEDPPPGIRSEIRRDHTATVVSYGEGLEKELRVNGIGITTLTPLTKLMAHMPLAFHGNAKSIAVICFGMGTTYRSALTWDVNTTAIDLARSVPEAFPYYFEDAGALMTHPKGRIVIDDGRRFLHRNRETFDVITIDPPPPLEAAGSSLLYSREFYDLLKTRLNSGGLLQQWAPPGEPLIESAIVRALADSFPHVVVFRSFDARGTHFTASMTPVTIPTAAELVARLPERALRDMVEWNVGELRDVHAFAAKVLNGRVPVEHLLAPDPSIVITDDRPFNEYYFVRRARARMAHSLD